MPQGTQIRRRFAQNCAGRVIERAIQVTTIITVCETCKRPEWDPEKQEKTDGELLAGLVEAAAEGKADVVVKRHACLMGCDFACNVSVQGPDKLAYVIGTFEPESEAADAIVEWAALHAQSETGQVPYRTWPAAIKGHFRARIPPMEK